MAKPSWHGADLTWRWPQGKPHFIKQGLCVSDTQETCPARRSARFSLSEPPPLQKYRLVQKEEEGTSAQGRRDRLLAYR